MFRVNENKELASFSLKRQNFFVINNNEIKNDIIIINNDED